jgi:hypothetical protein
LRKVEHAAVQRLGERLDAAVKKKVAELVLTGTRFYKETVL